MLVTIFVRIPLAILICCIVVSAARDIIRNRFAPDRRQRYRRK